MVALLLLIFLVVLLMLIHHQKQKRSLPPGPPSLPIIGSLPFITTKHGFADFTMDSNVTRHKPIATVWLGPQPVIIINCPKMARELFDKEEFCGRRLPEHHPRFSKGVFGPKPGANWQVLRKFAFKTLKDFGFGRKSLEETIHFEAEDMLEKVFASDGDILVGSEFNLPMINILWQIVAGTRFDEGNPRDMRIMEGVTSTFKEGLILFYTLDFIPAFLYPVIKMFPNISGWKKMRGQCDEMSDFIREVIDQHKEDFNPDNLRDFIDMFLLEGNKSKEVFNTEELIQCIWDFLLAGSETSSTTLKWSLLYLALNQQVQKRCREEIEEVIGGRRVSMSDLFSLPYLQATIAEVQRMSCVGPLSLPHCTTSATSIGRFSLPAKSTLFANLTFYSKNPDTFTRPHLFDPDRFLSPEGRFLKHEDVLPFGVGLRYCLGESLARSQLFIFLATLLQEVVICPPKKQPCPNPEKYSCNATRIPDDFYVHIQKI